MKIHNKIVLITGAALRLGREIALSLASGGAEIIIHYNRSRGPAERLKNQIEDLGRAAHLLACDFNTRGAGTEKKIQTFVKKIYGLVPRVDILINNASIFHPTPVGKIHENTWDEMLNVNLKVPFFLSQEIGMRMKKKGRGKIINIVDSMIARPKAGYLPYNVSKAGLHMMTVTLAKALAPEVQVNSVAPGPILPVKGMTPKQKKAVADKTLLKRFGDPQDICAAVEFLVEGTDYVTGAFIPVEGGSIIA